MIKKILVAIIALSLAAASLTSCSNSDSSTSEGDSSVSGGTGVSITPEQAAGAETVISLTVNGESIDTSDLVFCSIGGQDISFDEYRYYYLSYYDSYSSAGFDMTSDETFAAIKKSVENDLIQQYGIIAFGAECGVEFGSDVQQTADEAYAGLISSFDSVEAYAEALQQTYMTDKLVRSYYYTAVCSDKVVEYLLSDDSPYKKTKEDFLAAIENGEYSRTLNLLVPFTAGAELTAEDLEAWDELTVSQKSDKYNTAYNNLSDEEKEVANAKAKEIADEVLAKAKNGDDFYELIAQYNLDPGMSLNDPDDITSIDGYYITKDYSFVQEYIDGAFALEENEVSDLVETVYGYHIIKRLPIDMDYINANIDDMAQEYSDLSINTAVNNYLNSIEVKYCDYYNELTLESIK